MGKSKQKKNEKKTSKQGTTACWVERACRINFKFFIEDVKLHTLLDSFFSPKLSNRLVHSIQRSGAKLTFLWYEPLYTVFKESKASNI